MKLKFGGYLGVIYFQETDLTKETNDLKTSKGNATGKIKKAQPEIDVKTVHIFPSTN